MASLKTQPTGVNPEEFLQGVDHPTRRADGFRLLEIFKDITGEEPVMWGPSIVGFGQYHYVYESGREGDMLMTGFSPRKQNLSLYIMPGFERFEDKLSRLGKHKTSKACLYINKLADVDEAVLREMIAETVEYMRDKYS
ncbi:MAG: DUF1801 domain-containing protein [Bacteroidota bacterium]